MTGKAKFSDCGKYRWWLTRQWDPAKTWCAFIGLNPSTATAEEDDPTIHKCIEYAKSWDHGALLMLNLYAYRATHPKDLWALRKAGGDHIGQAGNRIEHILEYLIGFGVKRTVAAWGADKLANDRGRVLAGTGRKLDCLMRNSDGSPAHPLYLPYGLLPEPWNYK